MRKPIFPFCGYAFSAAIFTIKPDNWVFSFCDDMSIGNNIYKSPMREFLVWYYPDKKPAPAVMFSVPSLLKRLVNVDGAVRVLVGYPRHTFLPYLKR